MKFALFSAKNFQRCWRVGESESEKQNLFNKPIYFLQCGYVSERLQESKLYYVQQFYVKLEQFLRRFCFEPRQNLAVFLSADRE